VFSRGENHFVTRFSKALGDCCTVSHLLSSARVIPDFHFFHRLPCFSLMNASRLASYCSLVIISFAGTPIKTFPEETFLVTTLPPPMTEFSPKVTSANMETPPPIMTLSFTIGEFRKLLLGYLSLRSELFGAMNTLLPSTHSFVIVTWACTLQFFPMTTFFPMYQKLPIDRKS